MFTMAALLMHSSQVPQRAREALRAAHDAPPQERQERLESAARILFKETELPCADVLELVDLPVKPGGCR
jgi:hypothetical protein